MSFQRPNTKAPRAPRHVTAHAPRTPTRASDASPHGYGPCPRAASPPRARSGSGVREGPRPGAHTGRVRGFEVIRSLRESLGRLHASCIMGSYWASRSSFTLAGCLHFAIRISRREPGRQTDSKRLFIHTSRVWICESALLEPGRRFVFERLDASGMLVLLGQS